MHILVMHAWRLVGVYTGRISLPARFLWVVVITVAYLVTSWNPSGHFLLFVRLRTASYCLLGAAHHQNTDRGGFATSWDVIYRCVFEVCIKLRNGNMTAHKSAQIHTCYAPRITTHSTHNSSTHIPSKVTVARRRRFPSNNNVVVDELVGATGRSIT